MIQKNTSTPPPLPSGGKREPPKPMLLADYLEKEFIPAVTKSKTAKYLSAARRAVQFFGEFVDDRLVDKIDRDTLRTFGQRLCDDGYTKRSADDYRCVVAAIVRHYNQGFTSDLRTLNRVSFPDLDWSDQTLLRVVYEDRYLPERLARRSDQTKKHYRLSLENLDTFLGHPARLGDLTDRNVAGMLTWLVDSGRCPRTANNRRDYLLAFWRWCARKNLVDEWPDIDPLAEPKTIPRAWTAEQLERLLRACGEQEGRLAGISASTWWTALHGVFWDSGERTGAVLQLRLEDYDPATGELFVPAEIRKNPVDKLYILTDPTRAELAKMLTPERDLLFAFPFCLGTFYNHYTKLLKSAGLPHGRRDKPQKMRRSFASHLEAAGGNATEALGHSARSVTINSYLDERVVKREAPNKLLFDIATPNDNGEQNGKAADNGKAVSP